ncbi:NUDIX hydrolase [Streptomyces sp. NPDC051079]|uniref:NUDIX hydrolase n=1 Tax=Streptomyces sp. NPDC051079 TaxID=3155043 RepID=UPI00344D625B
MITIGDTSPIDRPVPDVVIDKVLIETRGPTIYRQGRFAGRTGAAQSRPAPQDAPSRGGRSAELPRIATDDAAVVTATRRPNSAGRTAKLGWHKIKVSQDTLYAPSHPYGRVSDHDETRSCPVSEWTVHGSRPVYESPWVRLELVDVEPAGQARYEHHLIKLAPVAAVVLLDDHDRVLLMWRHRFATDTWSWEIPSGMVEEGEQLAAAAAREVLEETGYRVSAEALEPLAYNQPIGGMCDAEHTIFLARDGVRVADPVDTHEADEIEWWPLAEVQRMIDDREIVAGVAVTALLQLLARRPH